MSVDKEINSPGMSHGFDKIKSAYEKTIPSKIELLTNSIRRVQQHPNQDNLTHLQNIIHKMGGSAGSYGYSSVSILCKDMDSEIGSTIAKGEALNPMRLTSLDDFLTKILQGFQVSSAVHSKTIDSKPSTLSRTLLYVVDEDIKFLELLARIKDQFSIAIETEYDPKKALERLMLPDFNPNILIVSQTFRTTSFTGFDLIEKVRAKQTPALIKFALFLDQDTIENRMEAAKLDVNYIFNKPISAQVLLKSVQEILEVNRLNALKVLVVDDEPNIRDLSGFKNLTRL